MQRGSIFGKFIGAILIASLGFVGGWQLTESGFLDDGSDSGSMSETISHTDLGLFWEVWGVLNNKYVEEDVVDAEERVHGAIKGMVRSFGDPYTVFMTPDETESFSASLEGTLEGIGAELTVEDSALTVVTPLKNSPAERAGLLPGDFIYQIEGEVTSDMSLFDAIMKIRGEKGTTVTLTIIRDGVSQPFDVSIVRDSIDIESVSREDLDGEIVYISVNQFNDKTNNEFNKIVSELVLNEPKGVIVDLRFNGGGFLDIAVELLSYFFPSDTEAVIIKERGKEDNVMLTNGNPKLLNVPLVVLINEGSASASEIFAGAVQDHERGILMGTQSFGKGSVQEVLTFKDGSSIRVTIAKWLTPDGNSINEVGLEPDIKVEISDEDIELEYDAQKEAALKYLIDL